MSTKRIASFSAWLLTKSARFVGSRAEPRHDLSHFSMGANLRRETLWAQPRGPSSSTERTRRHRQRRRRGTRCITVDVNEGEVAALVARGYLPEEARGDAVAIKGAIEGVISDLAFELEQDRSKGSGPRF
jgi:hypothetical protein